MIGGSSLETLGKFAEFGALALIAGYLLVEEAKQNKWMRDFMEKLRTSIDDLTDAIKGEKKK